MGAQRRVFPALKWSFKIHLLSGGNPQTSWRNKCKACGQQVSVPRGADLPPSTLQLSIPLARGMGPCSCPMDAGAWVGALQAPGPALSTSGAQPHTLLLSFLLYWVTSFGYQGTEIMKIC